MAASSQESPKNAPSKPNNKEIQVSGMRCFPENEWRNAIIYYLFGVWGKVWDVAYRPKINFGGLVTLRLMDDDRYMAFEHLVNNEQYPETPTLPEATRILAVKHHRHDVEVGLVRFVKDPDLEMLIIVFPSTPDHEISLTLWKKEKRGQYGIYGKNLVSSMDVVMKMMLEADREALEQLLNPGQPH